MEEEIFCIVNKIKKMFEHDSLLKNIVKTNPSVSMFIKNNKLTLDNICFRDFLDCLFVYSDKIVFKPEIGKTIEILKYKDFDELLKI